VSDLAQVEGFMRHREQLSSVSEAVSRECQDGLESIRKKAIEALRQATKVQKEIEDTIKKT
jgi:hypothetical protein